MEWISKLKDKFQCYDYIKEKLISNEVEVMDYKEINYGIQFQIKIKGKTEIIRIYESKKKGLKYDFSQIKSSENLYFVKKVLGDDFKSDVSEEPKKDIESNLKDNTEVEILNENIPLIGTDESGKGDFFGPLVIASVYADLRTQEILRHIGVDDSKKLTDKKIALIAEDIKKLCPYSIVVIGNEKYNKLYEKIGNLNKLLAWGHARAIENILEKVECKNVLADKFGNSDLIENALMEKGKKVNLSQRPRAEENVVVAAASILARNAFVNSMKNMGKTYDMDFVKGASKMTISVGQEFAERYTKERLNEVAKIHFSTFQKI